MDFALKAMELILKMMDFSPRGPGGGDRALPRHARAAARLDDRAARAGGVDIHAARLIDQIRVLWR